jgi:hypothetical protein
MEPERMMRRSPSMTRARSSYETLVQLAPGKLQTAERTSTASASAARAIEVEVCIFSLVEGKQKVLLVQRRAQGTLLFMHE